MKNIGDLLRLKRLEMKHTLEDVSKHVGVSINYIAQLEKGNKTNPSDDIVVKLACILELDEDSLFTSFGKIPLSTRKALETHTTLAKAISQINSDEELDESRKEEFLQRAVYWYKKMLEED
ncbi:helix-turn-helix domain-containing protein [Priestia megaterium]|uniref:helix-turn-helix domain-containing protein n=1 Tax=Priestia megaterium TaxID=1404 RepID=UPI0015968B79|nr:helix-turn-helix transcriptional regulator [Priestia megaterium]